MKKLITLLFCCLTLTQLVWADSENKFIVHITEKKNAMVVTQAIQNLADYYGDDHKIILVANGPAVELFQQRLGKKHMVENLLVLDVDIGVCAVALAQVAIAGDSLFPGVRILGDTGIVEIMELQKQGYLYVKI